MITRFISFFFSVTASICLIGAVLLLYPRYRLVNPELYEQVVGDSNLVEETDTVLQENVDSLLKDKIKVSDTSKFPPGLSAVIVRAMMSRVDLREVIQVTLVENGEYIANWLSGKSELYLYFPKNEVLESYNDTSGNENFLSDVMKISGYDVLPDCASEDQISEASFLKNDLSCGGVLVREFIRNEIAERSLRRSISLPQGFFDSVAPDLDEETKIEISQSAFLQKTSTGRMPELLTRARMYGIYGVILAVVTTFIACWLSRHPAKSFVKIMVNSGVFFIVFSLVAKLALRIVMDIVLWSKITFSPDTYSQEDIDGILDLLKNYFGAVLDKILLEIIIIGVVILVVAIVLYMLLRVAGFITKPIDEEEEEYEEYDEEDTDYEEPKSQKNRKVFEKSLLKREPNPKLR